ncbi:zinc-binding dehydrogenase [Microbacterium sp. zg.B48]|nr:zinc-binding dehydrogenase [Microbacterium sp. zg.B48]MCR2764327.1 zinc-binding dehydrogenase [Microbacterium sp. zg.B48]
MRRQVGDSVCALLSGGGYAEYCCVPEELVMPIPDGVGLIAAACLPEAACTAWSNLSLARPSPHGRRILVHGGSGGSGSMAIQVARMLGYRGASPAGTADGLAWCRALGADEVIDHRAGDVPERVLEWSEGAAADLILDLLGAAGLGANLASLTPD